MGDRNEKGRAGHRRDLIPLLFMHLSLCRRRCYYAAALGLLCLSLRLSLANRARMWGTVWDVETTDVHKEPPWPVPPNTTTEQPKSLNSLSHCSCNSPLLRTYCKNDDPTSHHDRWI